MKLQNTNISTMIGQMLMVGLRGYTINDVYSFFESIKGYKIGGAEVSEIHANFIVNSNNCLAYHTLENREKELPKACPPSKPVGFASLPVTSGFAQPSSYQLFL